jgi:hypothetical protein
VISQYADDTTIVCTTDDAVIASCEIYDQYEQASGARINAGKSKTLWLGLVRGVIVLIPLLIFGGLQLPFMLLALFLVQRIWTMKIVCPGSSP